MTSIPASPAAFTISGITSDGSTSSYWVIDPLIMHMKVLITLFQKMIWFIGVWATVHEILAIKISKDVDSAEI